MDGRRSEIATERNLSERLVSELGKAIVCEEVPPGSWFSTEAALSERFMVSRSVVREAVKILADKGLLEARPKRGIMVRPKEFWHLLDPQVASWRHEGRRDARLLMELIGFREVIEPALAAAAALEATEADVRELRRLVEIMAGVGEDRESLVRADHELHKALAAICGNNLLRAAYAAIEPGMAELRNVASASRTRGPEHTEDHVILVEAIAEGLADRAREVMAHIVESSRLEVMEYFVQDAAQDVKESRRDHRTA